MTISTINSALKIADTLTDAKPVSRSDSVELRIANELKSHPASNIPTTEKKESAQQFSTAEQSAIDDFIDSLRTTQDKKALFVLLNTKLRSLPTAERMKFLSGLDTTLKTSAVPGDETLLKEKFHPAYAMYIANDMFLTQMKEEVFSKMGQIPDENDEESDEI